MNVISNGKLDGFLGSPSMNFIPATLEQAEGGLAVSIDGHSLDLPPDRARSLADERGLDVIFGVRPELLTRARDGDVRPRPERLPVTFDLIQPIGSRAYGTFRPAGEEVTAELRARGAERPGERLDLHVDMNRAVLIDPASERVLQ